MKTRAESDEILYADDSIVSISQDDVEWLKNRGRQTSRGLIRLCSHPVLTDALHEMFLVLNKETFFPPHKHPNKSESIHIIEGAADLVTFNDNGTIHQVFPLGEFRSGRKFYCRMNAMVFHTLLIRSNFLVVHETINGPFIKGRTQYASWFPNSSDPDSCKDYIEKLNEEVASYMMNKKVSIA